MRISTGAMANAAAWAVIIGLVCVGFVMAIILGPFGLILLGLFAVFVCTSAQLRETNPMGGIGVFEPPKARHGSPEQRAAVAEEGGHFVALLRFCRWCGVVLLVAGVAGFAWQQSY